jgi:two-component system cell cycle response regulator
MGLGRQLGRGIGWFEEKLLAICFAVIFGIFLQQGLLSSWSWILPVTTLVLAALLTSRLWRLAGRFRPERVDQPGEVLEVFQLELLLLCATFLLLEVTGSTASSLYPVLFLLLAAIGGFDSSLISRVALVAVAVCLELILWWRAEGIVLQSLIIHLASITGFPFVVGVLEWAWTASERRKRQAEMDKIIQETERQAEEYRLSGMTSVEAEIPAERRREDLKRSSVLQVGISVGNILEVLEAALRPHTVAAYWLSTDESTVTLKDARPSKEPLADKLDAREGIVGGILKQKGPILLNNLRKSYEGLNYYRQRPALRKFVGVPLVEGEQEHLRGVLLADRKVDVAFAEEDKELLQIAAKEILRIVDAERRLNLMDVIRNEAQELSNATKGLIEAVTLQQVVNEVTDSARQIFREADFCAIALEEAEGKPLVIRAVNAAESFDEWKQQHIQAEVNKGNHLCSLVMRRGLILPDAAYDKRSQSQKKIFGRKLDPPGLRSVKVVPLKLVSSEEVKCIGAMVLASTRADYFAERGGRAEDVKRTLETISNVAAISIQNAMRYELLEQLATTDGLTGLHNHRRFQEMLEEQVEEASRYERKLSLMLVDIDHFKQVNDTYGHPKGDQVLRRVARVLNEFARTTDRVCRYGGEEFAIIMPQTDKEGGRLLAERFRTEIKEQRFQSEQGEFSVTFSVGVCTFPDQARHKQELIDKADQALYHAKDHGRDQTVHYADIRPAAASGNI